MFIVADRYPKRQNKLFYRDQKPHPLFENQFKITKQYVLIEEENRFEEDDQIEDVFLKCIDTFEDINLKN